MRERVAGLLHKAGALEALMQVRRWAPVHTLPIVTYHHVAEQDDAYPFDPDVADATPAQFRQQMEWIARHCTPIGVDELVRAIDGAPLPRNPVMVTFDDGYKSCHDVTLPILRAVGVRATFFVATTFINEARLYWWERIAFMVKTARRDGGEITYPKPMTLRRDDPHLLKRLNELVKSTRELNVDRFLDGLAGALGVEWNKEVEAELANALIMSWDEVRALTRAGMDVESHGRRHRVLQTLDDATLRDELAGARSDLEAQLGRPIRAIAYPVGRRISKEPRIRQALEDAGYQVGLSNHSGVNRIWPRAVRRQFPMDRWDIHRLATDRDMSHAMYTTQVAVPRLAYLSRNHG